MSKHNLVFITIKRIFIGISLVTTLGIVLSASLWSLKMGIGNNGLIDGVLLTVILISGALSIVLFLFHRYLWRTTRPKQ